MGSCFEGLLERDTIVQSEFEFDGWFKNYNFFLVLKLFACVTVPHGGGGLLGPRDPKAATWVRSD